MDVRREHKAQCKESGMGDAMFAADVQLPSKKFAEQKDNRSDRIHAASLLRLPVVEPDDFWRKVPTRREPVFRGIPLEHCIGNLVVNEIAIARLHDRCTPVTLKMFVDANFAKRPGKETEAVDGDWEAPVKLKAAQSAFFSYCAVLRALWPMDYTPEALGQLLVRTDWGGVHRTDAARAGLVELLFNRVMLENARRAVKKKSPVGFKRIKELWEELTENWQPKQNSGGAGTDLTDAGSANASRGRGGSRTGRGSIRGISTYMIVI